MNRRAFFRSALAGACLGLSSALRWPKLKREPELVRMLNAAFDAAEAGSYSVLVTYRTTADGALRTDHVRELVDFSVVPVPANPYAVAKGRSVGWRSPYSANTKARRTLDLRPRD